METNNHENFVTVPLEDYNEGIRATAILGAVCDLLRSDAAYASADIYAILGVEKKEAGQCTSDSDLKRGNE